MLLAAVISLLAVGAASGLQCKDEYGNDVDWYYAYKLPRSNYSLNPLVREGRAYAYISSNSWNSEWSLGEYPIDSEDSVLGKTLAPLYDPGQTLGIFHAMYNDRPPFLAHEDRIGITKGVLFGKGERAVWLVHSVPEFPPPVQYIPALSTPWGNSPARASRINSYLFPVSQLPFGHMSLCLSLPGTGETIRRIRNYLLPLRPLVYSSWMFENVLAGHPQGGFDGMGNEYARGLAVTDVTTVAGRVFNLYSKSRLPRMDIYECLSLANGGISLFVETAAIREDVPLGPVCNSKYQIQNVHLFKLPFKIFGIELFSSKDDRSKWAVSKSTPMTCVGELDRSVSHTRNAGGVICTMDANVWERFADTIIRAQGC